MTTPFDEILTHTIRLKGLYGARDADLEEMRKMFHMEWSDSPSGEWIKPTMSPSAFNAVLGAVRLMTSTEPQISAGQGPSKDKLERAARAIWGASGRVSLRAAHYDIIFSGVLFGEVCASVSRTADLVKFAEASGRQDQIARAKYISQETPYFIQVYNPATCYPDRDHLGLRGMLRTTETTWGEVYDTWGDAAEAILPYTNNQRLTPCAIWDWYDWQQRCVWVYSYGTPLYHEDHDLPVLPVVHGITEGTMLFSLPEQQRFAMLYPLLKSGLWKRENLSLTTLYTLIFTLASNPLLVHETNDEDPLVIDRTIPGGTVKVKPGDKLSALAEKIVDPAQEYGLDLASKYIEQSTISKQALGTAPVGGQNMAFSAISLLTQAGRLPLMGIKQVGGQTVAELLNIAMRWLKEDKVKIYAPLTGEEVDITADDIPDRLVLTCILEPDLPTDKLNLANVGNLLVTSGLASLRWVRENILSIGQSDDMDREIWTEKRIMAALQAKLTELAAKQQMDLQAQAAQQQQAMQPQLPPGGSAGPGVPGATSPAAGPGGPGQVQPSLPPSGSGNGQPPMLNNRPPGGQIGPGAPLTGPNTPPWQGAGPQARPAGPMR